MNESNQNYQPQDHKNDSKAVKNQDRILDTGLNAVSGGIAGSLIGNAIGGKAGAVTGAIAGVIVGTLCADAIGKNIQKQEHKVIEVLGEAVEDDEIPAHYSREQLQALSQPQ